MLKLSSTLQLVDHSTVQRIELLGPFINGFILVIALGAVTQFQQVIYLHQHTEFSVGMLSMLELQMCMLHVIC